jgi:hypothetical protein
MSGSGAGSGAGIGWAEAMRGATSEARRNVVFMGPQNAGPGASVYGLTMQQYSEI